MSETYLRIKTELIISTLTDSQFRTLLYLVAKSKNQQCYPSIRTLASDLNKSTTSVQKTLKELEEQGYIIKENRKTSAGKTTSNNYLLKEELFVKRKKKEFEVEETDEEKNNIEILEKHIQALDYDWIEGD